LLVPEHFSIMAAMRSLHLATARLRLKSADLELAAADLNDQAAFSVLLGAQLPQDWPAPLNDEHSKTYTLNYLTRNPDDAGWSTWYFLLPADENHSALAIGIGGFTGKPSEHGIVEVGYSVIPAHQGRGYASEALAALIEWAFSHDEVRAVTAQTLAELVGSIRVLEKNGFLLQGEGSEEGAIHFSRTRK
jgi:ribosomal-protein-alanine N-acetyltransferase